MKIGKFRLSMRDRLLDVLFSEKKSYNEHVREVWLLKDPESKNQLEAPKKIGLVVNDIKNVTWFHPQHGYRVRCFVHDWED